MASISNQNVSPPSSSSPSSSSPRYGVFLSFRGKDTRQNFISHLYKALKKKGIDTYKDDETLPRGKKITPEILKAIQESKFSIIVFSENYASSEWCLDELVKCIECMDEFGQTVLPIFYEMDPSNLTDQNGSYAKYLAEHEEGYKDDLRRVKRWRSALDKASDISGWDSRNSKDEAQLIEEIIEVISGKLPCTALSGDENLVGMDSHIRELTSILDLQFHDVRIVGIWGMGGIGKTTIARAVYDQLSSQFEGCCFLENVKESCRRNVSPAALRKELLSQILRGSNARKSTLGMGSSEIKAKLRWNKALIVLDDVDHLDQLELLAGKHDWFGKGSRVIITTRDKHVLIKHGVNDIYEVKTMNIGNALRLFSWHAFKENYPPKDLLDLSYRVISYVAGLPLGLKVLGSFLFGRTKPQWEDKLKELESIPDMEIQNVLRISFDALQRNQREIFLDIACFFNGEDKDYVTKILDSCNFCPVNGMEVLMEKSLISVSDNKVRMHDLLQEMGWEIVRNESIKEPGRRSRLWTYEDIYHVLTQQTGTENVEGLILDMSKSNEIQFSTEAFANMNNLRLLIISNVHLSTIIKYHSGKNLQSNVNGRTEEFEQLKHCKVRLYGNFKFLSHQLRCLYWHGYPLKYLPSNFYPKKLVELDMCHCRIEKLWDGKKDLHKLEFVNLSYSERLTQIPSCEGVLNLKRLILEGCTQLIKVHQSVGGLKQLLFLNLKDCKNLKKIPSSIKLVSLQILILSGCSKLKTFPEIEEEMKHLLELHLDGTAIEKLPSSIKLLSGLVFLNLSDCKNLACLPNSICNLRSLETLILDGCIKLEQLPENLGNLEHLKKLYLGGTSIRDLPPSIAHLQKLKELSCHGCKGRLPNFWQSLLWSLSSRRKLLECRGLLIAPLSGLSKLVFLDLGNCNLSAIPSEIGSLSSLISLDLSNNNFVSIPSNINLLSKLQGLSLSHCGLLQSLPELPASVHKVVATDCTSLEGISGLLPGEYADYRVFFLSNCFNIAGHQGMNSSVFTLLKSQVQSMLRTQLQGPYETACSLQIFVPGSDIPCWFDHQTVGSSISIHLPASGSSNCRLMGLALCDVCTVLDDEYMPMLYGLQILGKSNECKHRYAIVLQLDKTIRLDHLGLCYLPLPKNWPGSYTTIAVSVQYDQPEVEVRRLGVRLIYDTDVEEIDQTLTSSSRSHEFDESLVEEITPVTNAMEWSSEFSDDAMPEDSSLTAEENESVADDTSRYLMPEEKLDSPENGDNRMLNYVCNLLSCFGLACVCSR